MFDPPGSRGRYDQVHDANVGASCADGMCSKSIRTSGKVLDRSMLAPGSVRSRISELTWLSR